MIRFFTLLSFLFLATLVVAQPCEIGTIHLTKSDCNANYQFEVSISFDHARTSDSFTVRGNGHFYGTFAYSDLPITIGPLDGNFTGNYEFAIKDKVNTDCSNAGFLSPPYCNTGCHIYEITAQTSDCNNEDRYSITLNFLHQNTSDSFRIDGYGNYAYADLPVTLYGFAGDGQAHTFHFFDQEFHDCSAVKEVPGKYCGGNCDIGTIHITKGECNPNRQFYVTLDFDYAGTSDSFTVRGNGHQYGTFAYNDLPITIGPLNGNFTGNFEFSIRDILHTDCVSVGFLTPPYCSDGCHIYEVTAQTSDCNGEDRYNITFNFQFQNTSDSFRIDGYGVYAYADLPVTLYGFAGDGQAHTFHFFDQEFHDCTTVREVAGKNCGNCEIGALHIVKGECNDNRQFYVTIDFDYAGTSDSFTVQGNGHQYGTFAYSDLPITLGPLDGNFAGTYEFVVKDLLNPDCRREGVLNKPYCNDGCHIFEISVHTSDCNNEGKYSITFDFQYQNTSDSFRIDGYGTYAYTDLPVTLYGFIGDGNSHGFIFRDNLDLHCVSDKRVEGKNCGNNCEIGELHIVKGECNPNRQFYVTIDFDYARTSDSFTVQGNGMFYGTFAYNDLPITIGPLNGNYTNDFEFVVKDKLHPDCASNGVLHRPYCNDDCHIYEISVQTSDCNSEGRYSITFDFQYQNTSDSFRIDGHGTYAYADLPITLYGFTGDGSAHTFIFRDNLDLNCAADRRVEGRLCNECQINELELIKSNCNEENQFYVTINFQHEMTSDSFRIRGNGHQYGTFAYNDLPVILGPFNGNSDDVLEFGISDLLNESCRTSGTIAPPFCDNAEGLIRNIELSEMDCVSKNSFSAVLAINRDIPSGTVMNVYQGNELITSGPIDLFPLHIVLNLDNSPMVVIRDASNKYNYQVAPYTAPDCSGVAVHDLTIQSTVYPNPFDQLLYIETNTNVHVRLMSINGQVVDHAVGNKLQLSTVNISAGVYLLELRNDQSVKYIKVVKN